jgi:hypothetical protein
LRQHLGKETVLAAYARMNESAAVSEFTRDYMITDGESASAMSRLTAVERTTGRQVMVRLAQFARFRNGKACEFCSIIDRSPAAPLP